MSLRLCLDRVGETVAIAAVAWSSLIRPFSNASLIAEAVL